MPLVLAWIAFPLIFAAMGAGWGLLVERASGRRIGNELLLPVGWACVLVIAGTFTAFPGSAPIAVPLIAVGTVAGLLSLLLRKGARVGEAPTTEQGARAHVGRWALVAALAVILAYGAPVILSGQATFTGFVKLDDTSTWLNVVDVILSHGRSVASLPTSTFSMTFSGDIGESYPLGAFVLLGVGHGLSGIDAAWIFQPYLALCGAGLALAIFALIRPLVPAPGMRAAIAFLAAQPALLFGYSMWGGIKEMSAAFLLALGIALAAPTLAKPPGIVRRLKGGRRPAPGGDAPSALHAAIDDLRAMLPLGLAAGGLIQVLGIGAAGWVLPAIALVAIGWLLQSRTAAEIGVRMRSLAGVTAVAAASVIPVWAVLSYFLSHSQGLYAEGQSTFTQYGNLLGPLNTWQIFGIWPVGDFRFAAETLPTAIMIAGAILAIAAGIYLSLGIRRFGVILYLAVALVAVAIFHIVGATAWVTGKALAISSPALPTAALCGAAMLWGLRRASGAANGPASAGGPPQARASRRLTLPRQAWLLGPICFLAVSVGVVWSNVLAYHDVTIAPRARLAELAHIGPMLEGRGPTFVNMYEVYADRHFLRQGDPTEPAEYRAATLPTRTGAVLTKAAWASLDSFTPQVLAPYPSIVTQRTPAESRPPADYNLVYRGRFYELWQRPTHPKLEVIEQVPYGESNTHPFCGVSENHGTLSLCPLTSGAIPSCPQVQSLARKAAAEGAYLVASERPKPVVAYGDEVRWPGSWVHEDASHSLTPLEAGTATAQIVIPASGRYEFWLGGGFARGFEVSLDGRHLGRVKNELALFGLYAPVARLYLAAGVHKISLTYPSGTGFPEILEPGSGWNAFTVLTGFFFEPVESGEEHLIEAQPATASSICGHYIDWIDLVRPI